MTEEEARDWIVRHHGQAALDRLGQFVTLLVDEAGRQNLIAPSTIPSIWSRHIVDSAQLAGFSTGTGLWLDIGSGGGLPGVVLALLTDRSFVLCEPRKLRATFLQKAVAVLGLADRVSVATSKVEALTIRACTITARAVTGLDALVRAARGCADQDTDWILPLGQSGAAQIQASTMLRRTVFHVEPSLTDPTATILVARGIA
ncbi:16S rRNA (guanine(527)-N(7))-methyltransferase RsmG [uncultured Sphingomonas sp.]|uniref:16S rRNA (guanine(527)-N(7))-methyltransferase RsmG n=1 Tax=uncultured Sphingomonas sp. TaxID=158754 RepID=UPI0035CA7BF2